MRVYELRGNSLDALTILDRPVPRPGPRQVLVRVRATSLNYRDLLVATGRYPRAGMKLPLVPLSDGAGEVVEVGSAVTRLKAGDRVASSFFQSWIDEPSDPAKGAAALGGTIDGVLSEHVLFEERAAVRFPEGLSFEEAATLPCAAVTAWVGLKVLGGLDRGQTLLAMGTGGVSIFALQIAKNLGARAIVTSSHDEKLARATALGADDVVNYRTTPAWDAFARERTGGRGVDEILEVGGGGTLAVSLRALRDGGHLTLVGLLTGALADRAAAADNGRGIRIDPIYVGSVQHFEQMNAAFASWGLRPVVDRTFPFEEARQAYEYLQSGAHFGKVVIRL